jgi:predicted  nucleic acid-binding Zn-ribbon protein
MSGSTCKRCGSIFAPAYGSGICGRCEVQYALWPEEAAEQDAFRARLAERLNPASPDERARAIDALWGNPARGGFTRR